MDNDNPADRTLSLCCWFWLGGVAVFEAWRSDPSEITASILDTAFAEFRRHMPDYPLERMIDLLEKVT